MILRIDGEPPLTSPNAFQSIWLVHCLAGSDGRIRYSRIALGWPNRAVPNRLTNVGFRFDFSWKS